MHKSIKMIINVDWNKNGAWMSHYTTRKLGHNPKYALPIGVTVIFALVLNSPYISSWYTILFVLLCCSSCVATLIFSHCYVALLVLLCCFFHIAFVVLLMLVFFSCRCYQSLHSSSSID